jgi:hypothetical protein
MCRQTPLRYTPWPWARQVGLIMIKGIPRSVVLVGALTGIAHAS